MKINLFDTPTFQKESKRFKKKFNSFESDFELFICNISKETPDSLGENIFKYRLSIKSKNKGKSGGFRVITLEILVQKEEKNLTLLTVYDKSEQASITKAEIKQILKDIK